jgi:hypothetical protein
MELLEARKLRGAFSHVEQAVLPEVVATASRAGATEMAAARKQHLDRWWQFWNVRVGMRAALGPLPRYLACSRVTKRPIFSFVDRRILPDCALQVFALSDDYSFGILQSDAHWQWFIAKCSKLKSDFRYTPGTVFDTFPWPQNVTESQIDAVASAGREVRRQRAIALTGNQGGLRAIYRTLELPGKSALKSAHAALDAAVLDAYDFDANADLLEQIHRLNAEIANTGEQRRVLGPGVPKSYSTPAQLVSNDCVT